MPVPGTKISMTRKSRTILFLILLFTFIILAFSLILIAQGYRIDLAKKKIVKTGGIFITTKQSEVNVFLNGKLKKNIGQVFKSAFLQNLHPRVYNVALKKEGYFPLEKNLEVKEGIVTEINNIYLFPKVNEITKDYLLSEQFHDISEFSISPDGGKIALAVANKEREAHRKEIIVSDPVFRNPLIFSDGVRDVKEFSWSPDSKKILIQAKSIKDNSSWFLIDLARTNPRLELLSLISGAQKLLWHPKNTQYLFALFLKERNGSLYKYDIEAKTLTPLVGGVKDFWLGQEDLFWLDTTGFFSQRNLEDKDKKILNFEAPPNFNQKNNYRIITSDFGILGILENESIFYIFDKDNKIFQEFADGLKDIEIFDRSSLFYATSREVWVYFLEDYFDQPQRKKGDRELMGRFSEDISNLIIFPKTGEHLIFKVGDHIKIAELDSRDRRNIIDLASADGKTYYNSFDEKLYILNNGKLYKIDL